MTIKNEPTPDWAEQVAICLLICPNIGHYCNPVIGKHVAGCVVNRRDEVADALRFARDNALEEAAKAVCGLCANAYGRGDTDQPVIPHYDKQYSMWLHGDGTWRCDAGPIHALKGGE